MPNACNLDPRGILRAKPAAWALRRRPPVKLLIGLLGVLVGGCAITTPAPGGPINAGAHTQIQPQYAVAYGPASMTVDGVTVSGTAQTRGGTFPFPTPIPLAVGLRQSVGGFDVSADVGWVESGVELRYALPSIAGTEPLVISAGARTGRISAFQDDTYAVSLAVETYPVIAGAGAHSTRLMLSLGASAGTFVHELALPDRYKSASDAPTGPPMARVLRPEIRLQTSVGVYLTREHFAVGVALSPWFALHAEEPTSVVCQDCDGHPVIGDYAQSWGLSLSLTPSFGS
jgi:hypothetical protein